MIGTKDEYRDADGTDNKNGYSCPPSIAMDQFHWQKKMGIMIEEDFKDLRKHVLDRHPLVISSGRKRM